GFADDATKFADDGDAQLFAKLRESGAAENRVAVYWDPSDPTSIQQQDFLDRMIPATEAADQAMGSGLRGTTVIGSGTAFIKGGGRSPVNFNGGMPAGTPSSRCR